MKGGRRSPFGLASLCYKLYLVRKENKRKRKVNHKMLKTILFCILGAWISFSGYIRTAGLCSPFPFLPLIKTSSLSGRRRHTVVPGEPVPASFHSCFASP